MTDQNRFFFYVSRQRLDALNKSGAKATIVDGWVSLYRDEYNKLIKYCSENNVVITDAPESRYKKRYGESWMVKMLSAG